METKEKALEITSCNKIHYDSLENIEQLYFSECYKKADQMLWEIVNERSNHSIKNWKRDDERLNLISFLGGRGRGKTSVMLSLLSDLDNLQSHSWSGFYEGQCNSKKIGFKVLPYIDAAMLADEEFLVDVILAELWKLFEDNSNVSLKNAYEETVRILERDVKQKFVDIRKTYMLLRNKEKGRFVDVDHSILAPNALHDLACSMNLRNDFEILIEKMSKLFRYMNSDGYTDYFFVIPIDDLDMSGEKAFYIIEQLRKFFRLSGVIIVITSDINRLQRVCEIRFEKIYEDVKDRAKFVDEYLEKVLPYNLRIYLPELKGESQKVKYCEPSSGTEITRNEKEWILGLMARNFNLFFDASRRTRHFLQNRTLRGLANYFEKMKELVGGSNFDQISDVNILITDLKERLICRINNPECRKFITDVLNVDYDDINKYVIDFLGRERDVSASIGQEDISLGQVLYVCSCFEQKNIENKEFVDCIIMLYTILLCSSKCSQNTKESMVMESMFGQMDYYIYDARENSSPKMSANVNGMPFRAEVVINLGEGLSEDAKQITDEISRIIDNNRDEILSVLFSLAFYKISNIESMDVIKFNIEDPLKDKHTQEDHQKKKTVEPGGTDAKKEYMLSFRPDISGKKAYMSSAFGKNSYYSRLNKLFIEGFVESLCAWGEQQTGKEIFDKDREMMKRKISSCLPDIEDNDDVVIESKNVEVYYNLIMKCSRMKLSANSASGMYFANLKDRYTIIDQTLRDLDLFYRELGLECNFEECFLGKYPVKLILQGDYLDEHMNAKFESKLDDLLREITLKKYS